MDMELFSESLFDESPWIQGDLSAWDTVLPHAKLVTYKKNTIIYHQNCLTNNIYIVKEGRVNISILNHDGTEKSLFVVSTGALFGEVPIISNADTCCQPTTKTDCRIYVIPQRLFLQYLYSDSKTMMAFAQLAMKKIHLLTGQIELLSFFDINYRVCKMLSYLAQQYGVQTEDGLRIEIRFTHQELASMVGASRVSVTKLLNDLIKAGIISRNKREFLIVDVQKLREYAISTQKQPKQ